MLELRALICATLVLGVVAAAGPAVAANPLLAPTGACPGQSAAGASPALQERAMTCLVSWTRRAAGVGKARRSSTLNRSAQMKADLIARCGTLSHTACGKRWDGVLDQVGFHGLAYENLAAGAGRQGTPRAALAMWLNSPAHRSALLAPPGYGVRRGTAPARDGRGMARSGLDPPPGQAELSLISTEVWEPRRNDCTVWRLQTVATWRHGLARLSLTIRHQR